ncbi:glucose-1-phosphate adenylyltransferase [Paenibacillus sp. FSL H8-0548]|nr:glucose-1-phosphate adenylyltransferase [Paenibacillus sp. FSL H8-0548]
MLLAGGEGRRLAPLTGQLAKPAVPFGDRFRMIDFPLNNCAISNIKTIGVLTQYCADTVHNYVMSIQQKLHSDQANSDISFLPSSRRCPDGYSGTADAIYQNIDYIDKHNPEHVLILSGDHIYEMDYRPMLEFHKQRRAAVTIGVKQVPWRDASRFGILTTDEQYHIRSFHEKPAEPQSNLASMGIYLFCWSDLRAALIKDAANPASSHDFGKDIIPTLLSSEASMVAYPYDGYWRDVGTIDSLWEANMDLLDGEFKFNATNWAAYSSNSSNTSTSTSGLNAIISDSLMHPYCSIEAEVTRSIICSGVTIGEDSEVCESIIMPGATIGKNVTIHRAIIGEGAIIHDGAYIGSMNDQISVIAPFEAVASPSIGINHHNPKPLADLFAPTAAHSYSNALSQNS